MKLKNKTVVITGGATGIGRAMGLRFAREGAAVVISYNQSKTQADKVVGEIERAGGRALAPEIRVNAVAPGFVDTGFVNWTPEVLAELQKPTRLGNQISPEDVADAAVYLAADAKSTTGQTILVDAGDTALG